MVQEFQVLACFSCKCFQVHQIKKSKVWVCKLCGEKQSFLKSYGQGSGADCRRHVQKLNMMRGEMMQEAEKAAWSLDDLNETTPSELQESANLQGEPCPVSRWSKFVEKNNEELNKEEHEEEEILYTDRQQFYLDVKNRAKEKRKRKKTFHNYDGKNNFDEIDCCALTNEAKKVNWCKSWKDPTAVSGLCHRHTIYEDFRDPSSNKSLLPTRSHYSGMSLSEQANSTASKWQRFGYNFKYSENDSTYAKSKAQQNWAESESCNPTMALPGVQQQEQCSLVPFRDEGDRGHHKCSLYSPLKSYIDTVPPITKTTSVYNSITGSILQSTPFEELKAKCIWKDSSKLAHEKPRESSTKSQPACLFSTPIPCSSFASFSTCAENQASASVVLHLFQTDDDFDGDL